jgi:hypothetical protein
MSDSMTYLPSAMRRPMAGSSGSCGSDEGAAGGMGAFLSEAVSSSEIDGALRRAGFGPTISSPRPRASRGGTCVS